MRSFYIKTTVSFTTVPQLSLIHILLIFSVSACKPEPAKEDNDKIKGSLSGNTQQEDNDIQNDDAESNYNDKQSRCV